MSFKRRLALTILVAILAFFLGYELAIYQTLPPQIATKFDGQGLPQSWMKKEQYVVMNIAMQSGMAAIVVVIAAILPLLPNWAINVPYRAYWLAPDRRAATLERIGNTLIHIGSLTAAFIFVTIYFVDRFNIANLPRLSPSFWLVFAMYLLAVFGMMGYLFVQFFRHELPEQLR
jgi:serine/threonine-protein kinase